MRIEWITKGGVGAAESGGARQTDLLLLPLDEGLTVEYQKELRGETDFFERTARLSGATKSIVVCGCITDTLGHRRKSTLVAENGRLLGVSDMVHAIDDEVSCGATLRVYATKVGRMGVIVGEDLYFSEVAKSLAACGSDFLVCAFGGARGVHAALLQADAFRCGVPLFFCADGYGAAALPTGENFFSTTERFASWECALKREYHLVQTRGSGGWRR